MVNYLEEKVRKVKSIGQNKIKPVNKKKQKLYKKLKVLKAGGFYWKFIHGDIVVSTFINFLVKSGCKNRAIRIFFKAISALKSKFGINPVLLLKYIILRRNVLHRVTTKKKKKKTFYYLRLLDFDRQIKNTVRKLMKLVFYLKDKKHLKLWQCIFLVLLNFCTLSGDSNSINVVLNMNEKKFKFFFYFYSCYRKLRTFIHLYKRIYIRTKKVVLFLHNVLGTMPRYINYIILNISYMKNKIGLSILYYYKILYNFLYLMKHRELRIKKFFTKKTLKVKKKVSRYLSHYIKYLGELKTKKRMFFKSLKYKFKDKKIKETFLNYFFFKELAEFKKAAEFKNSILNFKRSNKRKRELSMGTRIHTKYDVKLRHRKIFFRVSKYGQLKK
uniref:Ribosomal protein S7 n=1 Tax=Naegleria fowleri TaxID=5763 RepID=A0A1D8DBI2_NAEFO|nr:ribosomal protein S7 [Naegleria fowleri]